MTDTCNKCGKVLSPDDTIILTDGTHLCIGCASSELSQQKELYEKLINNGFSIGQAANLMLVKSGARRMYYADGGMTEDESKFAANLLGIKTIKKDNFPLFSKNADLMNNLENLDYEGFGKIPVNYGSTFMELVNDDIYRLVNSERKFKLTDYVPSNSISYVIFKDGKYIQDLYSYFYTGLLENFTLKKMTAKREEYDKTLSVFGFDIRLWIEPFIGKLNINYNDSSIDK